MSIAWTKPARVAHEHRLDKVGSTGTMNSCLYEGSVRHRRMGDVKDEFHYPLFMVYLDLDELPGCFDGTWFWSARRPALAWFRRSDYLGDPDIPSI